MVDTKQTQVVYSDLMMNFDVHPIKKDLIRAINDAAVKRSIRNLLLTTQNERLFQPIIGSNVQQYLFDLISSHTAQNLQDAIIDTINNYEPRAKLIGVRVTPDYDNSLYNVVVAFYITNITNAVTLNINLQTLR
jgi:phage baseplate assembly protein W